MFWLFTPYTFRALGRIIVQETNKPICKLTKSLVRNRNIGSNCSNSKEE